MHESMNPWALGIESSNDLVEVVRHPSLVASKGSPGYEVRELEHPRCPGVGEERYIRKILESTKRTALDRVGAKECLQPGFVPRLVKYHQALLVILLSSSSSREVKVETACQLVKGEDNWVFDDVQAPVNYDREQCTAFVTFRDKLREPTEDLRALLSWQVFPRGFAARVDVIGVKLDWSDYGASLTRSGKRPKGLDFEGVYLLGQPVDLAFKDGDPAEDEVCLVLVQGVARLVNVEQVQAETSRLKKKAGKSPKALADRRGSPPDLVPSLG